MSVLFPPHSLSEPPPWWRTEVNIAVCCQFFNQSRWWVWHFHDIFVYEHEKYLPKCQNLNFTIFFIVCAMPCQETRPEDNNNNNNSSAAHNWRHFPQGASVATALPASLSTSSSSSLYLTALSDCARFSNGFSAQWVGIFFCLRLRFCVFRFASAQSPFAVCMCECVCVSVCVQLLLNPHHTRWLRFLAFPPLRRRFTFIHQKKKKQFGGGFHWQLEVEEKPFSHLPIFTVSLLHFHVCEKCRDIFEWCRHKFALC